MKKKKEKKEKTGMKWKTERERGNIGRES